LKVNLRFVGPLALKAGSNRVEFELPVFTTLMEAIRKIFKTYKLGDVKIDENGVNTGSVMVYLNGRMVLMDSVLKEDDEIFFLPLVVGG